jgi:hypothetical protein
MNKILTVVLSFVLLTPSLTHACRGTGLLGFFQNIDKYLNFLLIAFFALLIGAIYFLIQKRKKYLIIMFICTFLILIVLVLSVLSQTVGCSVGNLLI